MIINISKICNKIPCSKVAFINYLEKNNIIIVKKKRGYIKIFDNERYIKLIKKTFNIVWKIKNGIWEKEGFFTADSAAKKINCSKNGVYIFLKKSNCKKIKVPGYPIYFRISDYINTRRMYLSAEQIKLLDRRNTLLTTLIFTRQNDGFAELEKKYKAKIKILFPETAEKVLKYYKHYKGNYKKDWTLYF